MPRLRWLLIGSLIAAVAVYFGMRGAAHEQSRQPSIATESSARSFDLPPEARPPAPLPAHDRRLGELIACDEIYSASELGRISDAVRIKSSFPGPDPVRLQLEAFKSVVTPELYTATEPSWLVSSPSNVRAVSSEVVQCTAGAQNNLAQQLDMGMSVTIIDHDDSVSRFTLVYTVTVVDTGREVLVAAIEFPVPDELAGDANG